MRRKLSLFLVLLPLMMLIVTPCSLKQNVKELLGVESTLPFNVEDRGSSICTYVSGQDKINDTSKIKQYHFNIKSLFDESMFQSFSNMSVKFSRISFFKPIYKTAIPIFLVFRKLII